MKAQLQSSLKDAMRAKDKVQLETIRSLLSALQYEEMQRGVDQLSDTEATEIFKRELKKRKEELEFAEKSNRSELTESIRAEMAIIERFLPQQMGAPELEKILTDLKAGDPALNMGGAMKVLKERYAGQYDAKAASELAKRICG